MSALIHIMPHHENPFTAIIEDLWERRTELSAATATSEQLRAIEHVINELENEKMMYEQRNADILERQQRVTELEAKVARTKEELAKKKGDFIRKAREQSAAMVGLPLQ